MKDAGLLAISVLAGSGLYAMFGARLANKLLPGLQPSGVSFPDPAFNTWQTWGATNCQDYAWNDIRPVNLFFPSTPGPNPLGPPNCASFVADTRRAGMVDPDRPDGSIVVCRTGYRPVHLSFIAVTAWGQTTTPSSHYMRQDDPDAHGTAFWSEKLSTLDVPTNRDADGKLISDPEQANRNYSRPNPLWGPVPDILTPYLEQRRINVVENCAYMCLPDPGLEARKARVAQSAGDPQAEAPPADPAGSPSGAQVLGAIATMGALLVGKRHLELRALVRELWDVPEPPIDGRLAGLDAGSLRLYQALLEAKDSGRIANASTIAKKVKKLNHRQAKVSALISAGLIDQTFRTLSQPVVDSTVVAEALASLDPPV